MEPLRQQVPLSARTAAVLALGLLACGAAGCVTPGSNFFAVAKKPAAVPVTSMAVMWHNQVAFGADPTQRGAEVPAVIGRAYLFGPDQGFPQLADGDIVAELYPVVPNVPPGRTPPLEVWEFKKEELNKSCLKRDFLGQGYTLALRWSTYRPEYSQVYLKVRYVPPQGPPVYGESTLLTLNSGAELSQVARSRSEGLAPTATAASPAGARPGQVQQVSASPIAGTVPARPTYAAPNLMSGSPTGVVPAGGFAPAAAGAPVNYAAPAARPGTLNLGRP